MSSNYDSGQCIASYKIPIYVDQNQCDDYSIGFNDVMCKSCRGSPNNILHSLIYVAIIIIVPSKLVCNII